MLLKVCTCIAFHTVLLYFIEFIVDILFGTNSANYKVDFNNWAQHSQGNVTIICLVSLLLISAVLFVIGFLRVRKSKKR